MGPDITETLKALAREGEKQVVIVPLGYFCEHVEILFDLDCHVRTIAEQLGMRYLRAEPILNHPKTIPLFKGLIEAQLGRHSNE